MPSDWTETTLGSVGHFQNGYPFKPAELGDEGLPVIRIRQLLNPNDEPDRTPIDVPARNLIDNGDLVFSWSGTLAVRRWDRGKAALNQHLFRVTEEGDVNREWLALALQHAIPALETKSHGSTMRHITKRALLAHPVLLPPMDVQLRIVDLVGAVDTVAAAAGARAQSARDARRAMIDDLMAQSIGGEAVKLGDVCEAKRNRLDPSALPPDTPLTHWSIPALDDSGGPLVERAGDIGSHKFVVSSDAVALSLLNPRIPRTAVIPGGTDVVCSTEFAVLVPGPRLSLRFLSALVSWAGFYNRILNLATGTTKSRERVRPKDLINLHIALPALHEQERIVDLVGAVDDEIAAVENVATRALSLRSALLHELLSGERAIPASYDRLLEEVGA